MERQLSDGWTPRDTAVQQRRVTRHSTFVTASKYGLFLLAVVLVGIVFIFPALHDSDEGARLVFTNIQTGESPKPRMLSPIFQGTGGKNQKPYRLDAEYADRLKDGSIFLHKINADITMDNGDWVAIKADEGIYNTELKTLLLPKNVQVFHQSGYEMRTQDVRVDLNASQVTGEQLIEMQSESGILKAVGFQIDGNRKTILFSSRVKVRLYLQKNG